MSVTIIDSETFEQNIASFKKSFAVFESELLENQYFDQQLKENPQQYPTPQKADLIINKIDRYAFCSQLWENSDFDGFKDQGPIFVEFEPPSPLVEKYLSEWGNTNVGIFIQATSREALIKHLQSIFMVDMPDDGQVYHRLQESRKLAGVLQSLNDERFSQLLGPIHHIYWQENCGKDIRYYQAENVNPYEHSQQAGWFHFTRQERDGIDAAELSWYKRSILSEIIFNIEQKLTHTLHLQKYTKDDLTAILESGYNTASMLNIKSSEGLRFFLLNSLYYPNIMNSKPASSIVQENCPESKKIKQLKDLLSQHENHHEVTL